MNITNLIKDLNFNELTPIQKETIKHFKSNKNLVGIAPTGTGKTHAYLIPVVENLELNSNYVQAIILIPTNELILQVREMLRPLESKGFSVKAYHSRMNVKREEDWLRNNQPHVVITTPERLSEMRGLGLNINQTKYLVLDEADMMFDESFLGQLDNIVSSLTNTKFMLFSASITENMFNFIKKYFGSYDLIDTTKDHNLKIEHKLVKLQPEQRLDKLVDIAKSIDPFLAIVFVSRKKDQQEIYERFMNEGFNSVLLSGDLNQHQRKQVLSQVHDLKYQYVIASDLASRGIDFDASHVINYDLPYKLEFFKHRSGRTGRMNREGVVITLVDNDDRNRVTRLANMGFDFKEHRVTKDGLVLSEGRKEEKLTEKEIQAIKSIPKPKRVKPNYRKKNKKRIQNAKRAARGTRGRR